MGLSNNEIHLNFSVLFFIFPSFLPGLKPSVSQNNRSKGRRKSKNTGNGTTSNRNSGNNKTVPVTGSSNHGNMVCYIKIKLVKPVKPTDQQTTQPTDSHNLDLPVTNPCVKLEKSIGEDVTSPKCPQFTEVKSRKRKLSGSSSALELEKRKKINLYDNTVGADTTENVKIDSENGPSRTDDNMAQLVIKNIERSSEKLTYAGTAGTEDTFKDFNIENAAGSATRHVDNSEEGDNTEHIAETRQKDTTEVGEVHITKRENFITISPYNPSGEPISALEEGADSMVGLISGNNEDMEVLKDTVVPNITENGCAVPEEKPKEAQHDVICRDAIRPVNFVKVIRYSESAMEDLETQIKHIVRKRGRPSKADRAAKRKEKADDVDTSVGIPPEDETSCPICCETFETHEQLKSHIRKTGHYERNWMCKLCYKRFIIRRSLKEHIEHVHKNETKDHMKCKKIYDPNAENKVNLRETIMSHLEDTTPCDICAKMVKGKNMEFHVKTHKARTGRRRIVRCYHCGLCFGRPTNLLKHTRLVHKSYFQCDLCGEKFNGRDPLKLHRIRVHGEDSHIKCEICGIGFARPDQLRNHRLVHSDTRLHKCTLCSRTFKDNKYLNKHVDLHHGVPVAGKTATETTEDPEEGKIGDEYLCTKCGSVFKGDAGLQAHIKRIHPEDVQSLCTKCGSVFKGDAPLRSHIRQVHPEDLQSLCTKCGSVFKGEASLQSHIRQAHPEDKLKEDITPSTMNPKRNRLTSQLKEHLCTQCGKVLKGKSSFLQHVKWAHSDVTDEYPCGTCGKTFKSKCALEYHAEWHLMKENPNVYGDNARYKCPMCDRGFKYKAIFKTHKKTHKEFRALQPDKSVQCTICEATLKSEKSFKDHMDNHAGVFKFPCTKCDKVFTSKSRLYNHHMVHKDVNYQCDLCGASFKQKSYLKRHIANKHGKSD